ncbi:MAG: TrkA family potassium uptake protein [Acidimicrobiia bacterium]|nr:TrkA family potassium uptake protein [Acidimicrobiia bacterium]
MRVVIVGGGKVGAELAERLLDKGSAVMVIEEDEDRARLLSDMSEALILTGDGTDMRRLESLDLKEQDVFVSVTGVDEDNLVACQLASAAFGVRRVLARMNNPKNAAAFRALGVPTVNVTDQMSDMIERSLDLSEEIVRALPERGDLRAIEISVPDKFPPTTVTALELPPSTVVVSVTRDGRVAVPDGGTEVLADDRLLFVTHHESLETLHRIFQRHLPRIDE